MYETQALFFTEAAACDWAIGKTSAPEEGRAVSVSTPVGDNRRVASQSSPTADARSTVDVLRQRYAQRLPTSLHDLAGPTDGEVELPLHIAWSGLRTYNLHRPRQRMSYYRTVLTEGQRDDLTALLDGDLLVSQWPVLRTLVSLHIRDVWEAVFPALTGGTSAAA